MIIKREIRDWTLIGYANGRRKVDLLLSCGHRRFHSARMGHADHPMTIRCLVCERKEREAARVREHAPVLLAAAKEVVARWEKGDLAEAVRNLADAIGAAEGRVAS